MTDNDLSQSSSNASDGDGKTHRRVGKHASFWVLYGIVLTASIVFAIYQGVRFFQGQEEGTAEAPKFPSLRQGQDGRIGPPELAPTTGLGAMTGNVLAGVGMEPVDGDPGGLVPPKGAQRRPAFVRRVGREVEIMALYAWRGSFDQAAEYYKEYLGRKGMTFLGERTKTGASASTRPKSSRPRRSYRVFVFQGPKRHVTVTLRRKSENDEMLLITLNLVYPESQR
jgi:hypothetical protein